ncbi:hypothetical protein EV360DRAFT_89809 [Lentinula raphanica]|nr:hypothetical protein EV360DRAFT_89809 [Lentinula raphanica]
MPTGLLQFALGLNGNLPPSGSTSVSTPSSSKFPVESISSNSPHSLAPTSPISAALCDAEPPKQQHPQSIFSTHPLRSKSLTPVCFGKREVFLIRRANSFVYLAETPLYASSRKLDTLSASALQTRRTRPTWPRHLSSYHFTSSPQAVLIPSLYIQPNFPVFNNSPLACRAS